MEETANLQYNGFLTGEYAGVNSGADNGGEVAGGDGHDACRSC